MIKKIIYISLIQVVFHGVSLHAANLLVEAEGFMEKGDWVVDQQFIDLMGSPYLLAHGLDSPVENASTNVQLPENGTYYIFVRTYNWTSSWQEDEGPGLFGLSVNKKKTSYRLGIIGNQWMQQCAGQYQATEKNIHIVLHDLKDSDRRCDTIYFTTRRDDIPPSNMAALNNFRHARLGLPAPLKTESYDLVVIGTGITGMSTAVSAARLGCKVALIDDHPVIGGNNNSEIRVHLGRAIEIGKYPELGELQKEFGPVREGNAQPAGNYEDHKKMEWLQTEANISLFLNYRVFSMKKEKSRIISITACHIESGEEIEFYDRLFTDCTSDGIIGYLAGTGYRMGHENRSEYGGTIAPEIASSLVIGTSVQWYSVEDTKTSYSPELRYGIEFSEETCEPVTYGEWTWETGTNRNQINDSGQIRDYGVLVTCSSWSYLKNRSERRKYCKKRSLGWVAYIAGKRESRRLLGDYVLKEDDLIKHVAHEDASLTITWSIDLHRPDPEDTQYFPGREFRATTDHVIVYPYPVPYRCLYSRNIDNLFMAGRGISVTHVALGTVRVIYTTGMMGEIVGMAAPLCKKYQATPRDIYHYYLEELKSLMQKGVNKKGLPNNQQYNEGGRLNQIPKIK